MRPDRHHITMRLRVDLIRELDDYVKNRQETDDRMSRTEAVEDAIRLLLLRVKKGAQASVA